LAEADPCSYCGREPSAPLDAVLEHMLEAIRFEYRPASEESPPWDSAEGGYQAHEVWFPELLYEEMDNDFGDDRVRGDIEAALLPYDDAWFERDWYALRPAEQLVYSWRRFATAVQRRPSPLQRPPARPSDDPDAWAIARLEKRAGFIPAWAPLPAKIHLQREEVEALFAYVAEARASITELKDTEYLVVRTGGGAPNIQGLAALVAQVAQNPDAFRPLTSLVGADQLRALRAVINLGRFENAKAELDGLIAANPLEFVFQSWFERNPWVFGSEYVEQVQPRQISPDSQLDLLFLAVDCFADLFEIKRPGVPVLVQPAGRNFVQPSGELNSAFGQAVHYLAEARAMALFNRVRRDIPVYQPRIRLVIGRSDGWDERVLMAFRDITAAWHQVDVLTYDMVLLRIDRLVQTLTLDLRAATRDT